MKFRKKTGQEKPKLSSLQAAKMSEELFIQGDPYEEIKKIKNRFFIDGTDTEILICFFALYLVAFMKTAWSAKHHIKESIASKILQNLVSSFTAQKSHFGLLSMDPNAVHKKLKEVTEQLSGVWEQSKEMAAGSDWYIGKEVYAILNGHDKTPPPDLVMFFSSLVKDYFKAIAGFAKNMEQDYTLEK